MPKKNLIVALVLYVVSASLSFAAFSYLSKDSLANSVANKQAEDPSQTLLSSLLDIDPNEAKDQVCPLNGAYYTQTEKTAWEQRRPLL